jgi:hypothetical protein
MAEKREMEREEKINDIKTDLKGILALMDSKSQEGDLTWLLIEINLIKKKLKLYLKGKE